MSDNTPPPPTATAARKRLLIGACVLLALVLLSTVWTFTPLRELIDPRNWLAWLTGLGEHRAAPWALLGGFLLGGLLALPVTAMVIVSIAAFGPVEGFCYALTGTTASALLSFGIGRALGRRQLEGLAGSRLHAVSLKLRSAGITTIAAVRMVPITHFTVVSLVAGVSHIRVRDFALGTILGMAPGIGLIALFFDQLSAAARRPSVEHLLWLAAASLAMLATLLYCRRFARARASG